MGKLLLLIGIILAGSLSLNAETAVHEDDELTILAFGDMMLGRYVRVLMEKEGMDYVFEELGDVREIYDKEEDVIFANLEGPIKGEGRKGGTSMIFSFNEDVAPFIKDHGFNVLSIANNHSLDAGWDGRDTTIEALEGAGLAWCGHPTEADPGSIFYGEDGERTFAFVCFNDVIYRLDKDSAISLVETVAAEVDYLIVSIHWGNEYKFEPNSRQIGLGHDFIDSGADLIIGHHPHVVQSHEIYNDRYIFYSLGNFIFDQYWASYVQDELAIGVTLKYDGDELVTEVELFPMRSERSQPKLVFE